MSALPPPATLLNLVGARSDAHDCWKVVTDQSHSFSKASPSPQKNTVEAPPCKRLRVHPKSSVNRHTNTPFPTNKHAKDVVGTWMKKRHVVVVGRVEWPESFNFMANHLGVLDSGYIYMCALDLYQRHILKALIARFLQRIVGNHRFSEFIKTVCDMEKSPRDTVDATTEYIRSMSASAVKKKKDRQSRATATTDNAPACVSQCINSKVPMVNHIRMQLGAVVAAAAHESGLDWEVLAEPIVERLRQSTENRDRVPELKKWIEYAAKNPMDTRLCHTRRGPDFFKSELTCPFKGGPGNDNVLACMNSRGLPLSPHLDLNSMTVSSVWTLETPKASHSS